MTTTGRPRRRVGSDIKRTLFVVGVLWSLFLLFGVAMLVFAHDPVPLVGALISPVPVALVLGLIRLADRLFPADNPPA